MKLSAGIHEFFSRYLPHLKGVSGNTIKTYRDTFTLFLPFAARYYTTSLDALTLEHLSVKLILSFLDHLEKKRNNIPPTRNLRLAAIKSFAKMVRLLYPDYREQETFGVRP